MYRSGYTRTMSMRRLLLRLLVAAFFLNASGLAFSAEQFTAGIAHDMELVSPSAGDADFNHVPDSCKHKCQGHYAQHFTVIPSQSTSALVVQSRRVSLPELVTRAPTGPPSSLFRPPRASSL